MSVHQGAFETLAVEAEINKKSANRTHTMLPAMDRLSAMASPNPRPALKIPNAMDQPINSPIVVEIKYAVADGKMKKAITMTAPTA